MLCLALPCMHMWCRLCPGLGQLIGLLICADQPHLLIAALHV